MTQVVVSWLLHTAQLATLQVRQVPLGAGVGLNWAMQPVQTPLLPVQEEHWGGHSVRAHVPPVTKVYPDRQPLLEHVLLAEQVWHPSTWQVTHVFPLSWNPLAQ